MAAPQSSFATRTLAELRDKHRERVRLETELAECNAAIQEIELTAPPIAEVYAADPSGYKAVEEVLSHLMGLVVKAIGPEDNA